mmetsp:Transcript_16213/g.41358  ORF Transcript_16213/g.41358 Transcript_16213/m.41358 type:complete len:156 (+) Transcript_16213:497-964(+)
MWLKNGEDSDAGSCSPESVDKSHQASKPSSAVSQISPSSMSDHVVTVSRSSMPYPGSSAAWAAGAAAARAAAAPAAHAAEEPGYGMDDLDTVTTWSDIDDGEICDTADEGFDAWCDLSTDSGLQEPASESSPFFSHIGEEHWVVVPSPEEEVVMW